MHEIVNKFLRQDAFKMHLIQPAASVSLGKPGKPGFTRHACGSFTKSKERFKQFKETRDSIYIFRNRLDKA